MGKPEQFPGLTSCSSSSSRAGSGVAEVRILQCISFQKFRYKDENRPGMRQQDKDYLTLRLTNLRGHMVKVQLVCLDAEWPEDVHPNSLVGKDCQHGVYTHIFPISKADQEIRIPYLRTERVKTREKKKKETEGGGMEESDCAHTIHSMLQNRAALLPSPYKEWCLKPRRRKLDTRKICLGVIVTVKDSSLPPLFKVTNVIQDASEKTHLQLLKLSTYRVSAENGGQVDIFTSEGGPPITAGKCRVWVTVGGDTVPTSKDKQPTAEDILYNRVVTYSVPPYAPSAALTEAVEATLHLCCTQSHQTISSPITYEPGMDCGNKDSNPQPATALTCTKRANTENLDGILTGVKLRQGKRTRVTPPSASSVQDSTGVRCLQTGQQNVSDLDMVTDIRVLTDVSPQLDDTIMGKIPYINDSQQFVDLTAGNGQPSVSGCQDLSCLSDQPQAVPVLPSQADPALMPTPSANPLPAMVPASSLAHLASQPLAVSQVQFDMNSKDVASFFSPVTASQPASQDLRGTSAPWAETEDLDGRGQHQQPDWKTSSAVIGDYSQGSELRTSVILSSCTLSQLINSACDSSGNLPSLELFNNLL